MRLTDKNKTLTYSEENQINLARRKNGIKIKSWYYGEPIERLAQFEDFMEEQGFESLEELKECIEIQETNIRFYSRISEENSNKNQALKARWEKLKDYVNTPKEFQEWREEMEITVDSIKAKMQELEK